MRGFLSEKIPVLQRREMPQPAMEVQEGERAVSRGLKKQVPEPGSGTCSKNLSDFQSEGWSCCSRCFRTWLTIRSTQPSMPQKLLSRQRW